MNIIDFKSIIDVTSYLTREQARKCLSRIFNFSSNLVSFSRHGLSQMKERNLSTVDILNVLRAGKILNEPEKENGSWRYRVETAKIAVIIAFRKPNHVVIVTAWRK